MPDLTSQIVAVTVFTDRARVTRRAQVALDAGTHSLRFLELPATLDPASLRVAARGTAPAKLLGVDARNTFFTESPAAVVRELEARQQALQDADSADLDRQDTLTKQLSHLDGLADGSRLFAHALVNGKMTLDQETALLAFFDQQRSSVQERLRALGVQWREREKELNQVGQQLKQLRAVKQRERFAVHAEIAVAAPAEVEVNLTYVIPQASWRPLYDIRLRGEELEITYLGEIEQNTGEDWTAVALTLSTARPAVAAGIPRLQPWLLRSGRGAMDAAAAMTLRAAARSPHTWTPSTDDSGVMAAAPAAAPMADAEVATATVEAQGGSVTFQIAGRVDVPSDKSPHKATVGIFRLPPQFDYVGVPKLVEAVCRRARVTNNSPYLLLPGRGQLFLEDDFLGASDLKLTAPGQQFELFFGADDRIRVERGLTKQEVSKTFLGGRRRIQYAYEIRLWNHTTAPQNLTIVDQIPLARHEDIKVTLGAVEPRPERQDDLNIVIWKLTIAAGAEQKIRFAFTVEHPRELPVSGLA